MAPARWIARRVAVPALLAAGGACAASPAAPSTPESPRSPERADPASPRVPPALSASLVHSAREWCVSGGAPLVGHPVVDAEERIYFATSDGYLHAFESDGRYRFSYTVQGTPLGSVSLRPGDGAILLGTTRRLVYAIGQGGSLKWSFETLTPVWSGIVPLDRDTVSFVGLDRHLYALGTGGGAKFRVKIQGQPVGEPIVTRRGLVWVPLSDGVARIENAWKQKHLALSAAVDVALHSGDGLLVRSGEDATLFAESGEVLDRKQVVEVGGSESAQVFLFAGGRGAWRSAAGEREFEFGEERPPSGALFADASWLAIPLEDGRALVQGRDGETETVVVGSAAIERIQMGPSGKRLIVSTREGDVCSVRLRSAGSHAARPR